MRFEDGSSFAVEVTPFVSLGNSNEGFKQLLQDSFGIINEGSE